MACFDTEINPRAAMRFVRNILETVFLITAALFVVVPTVRLVLGPLSGWSVSPRASAWALLFSPGTVAILWRNLLLAVVVTAVACIVGTLLAAGLARIRPQQLLWIVPLILAPLLADQLARNYGWYFLLRRDGIINWVAARLAIPGNPFQMLYRLDTVALAIFQGLFPLAVLPVFLFLSQKEARLKTVGMIFGAGWLTIARSVMLPLLVPSILLAVCFIFTASFGYFITPRMLGGDAGLTIAGLIDQRINLILDWSGATALAGVLVIACLPFFLLFLYTFAKLEPVSGFSGVPIISGTRAGWLLRLVILGTIFLLVVSPLLPVAFASFTKSSSLSFPPDGASARWYWKVLTDSDWLRSWCISIAVASISASVTSLLSLGSLAFASRGRFAATVSLMVGALPLMLPPIALAVGLYRTMVGIGLSNEWARLVAGHVLRGLPFPVLSLLLAWKSIDPAMLKAASIYGSDRIWSYWKSLGPHFAPALIIGFLLSWLTSFADLEYALFLSGPNTITLPIRMWGALSYSAEPSVRSE